MDDAAAVTATREAHPWVAEARERVRFGVCGPVADWPREREWAQRIERLGFDALFVSDHPLVMPADCWTTLAALAVSTERLRLGSIVSCVYYRPAALLAQMAAHVDRLSGGRLVPGLGAGDVPAEFAALGLEYSPFSERAAAVEDSVRVMRGLFAGETVTLKGHHVRAVGATVGARPVQQPHVPILIAGGGERVTLRQVARHADMCNFGASGLAGSAWDVSDVRRKLAVLDQHCAEAGRPPDAVLRSHLTTLVAAPTEAALDAKLAARPDRARMLEAARDPSLPRQLTTSYRLRSVEGVRNDLIAGTPRQLVAYFGALVDSGMRYFLVSCGQDDETLDVLGREMLPAVTA